MAQHRRHISPAQQEVISALEARYAHLSLRFDMGFNGAAPVQASGRIGRHYFYFRFRHDTASLTVGSPLYYRDVGLAKRFATETRRRLRRGPSASDPYMYAYKLNMKPKYHLRNQNTVPSYRVRASTIEDVTGNEYAGTLDSEQAAYLFERLLSTLEPCSHHPRESRPYRSGYTAPMAPHRVVIAKKSKRRR